MPKNLSITYFGRRGGGAHFSQGISQLQVDLNFLISSRNLFSEFYGGHKKLIDGIPSGLAENFLMKRSEKEKIINQIVSMMGSTSVSMMQHPLDISISKRILFEKRNISVVHDAKAHMGDFWPNYFDIKKRVKLSTEIITLSNYSRDTLFKSFSVDSEVLPLIGPTISFIPNEFHKEYDVAFVGRRKPYKGNNNFIRSITSINQPLNIIANMLSQKEIKFLRENTKHKINSFPRWIDDLDLLKLISKCRILVLPYTGASQSGWIPIARDLGVAVVSTNVGGLSEQFISDRDGILITDNTAMSLKNGIHTALKRDWLEVQNMDLERNLWIEYLNLKNA